MSEKIVVVTDTNSGISSGSAAKLGIKVVPMPFTIDDETYYEGINLNHDKFFKMLKDNCNISTSQPSPATIMDLWDDLLKEYDSVVYIPMSSALSSSCATATMLAEEYDGAVQVVDNLRISVTQRQSVLDALKLIDQGKSAKQIKEILEGEKLQASIYIMVDTLKYLQRGGRVTPTVAAIGTLLRLKPVLQIQGEKLDSFSKARNIDNAMNIMVKQLAADIEQRFGGCEHVHLQVSHTQNEQNARILRQHLSDVFPLNHIHIDPLSLSISCHIGPGALAVACTKKL